MTSEDRRAFPADAVQLDLRPLREHRLFIIVFILSAMLSALVLTYVYSERYRAETSIYFESSEVMQLQTHTPRALGSPPPLTEFKTITQTISGLIGSDTLLRPIVVGLHLDAEKVRDYSGPWYQSYYRRVKDFLTDYGGDAWMLLKWGRIIEENRTDATITKLRKLIKVRGDNSFLFNIAVSWDSPERALAVAERLGADLAAALHRENVRASTRQSNELATLRAQKAREIEALERQVRDLLASNHIASIKDELERVTERSSKLLQDRADTLADLRQSDGRSAAAAEKLQLAALPVSITDNPRPAPRRGTLLGAEDYAKFTSKKLDAEIESRGLRGKLASLEQSHRELVPRISELPGIQAQYNLFSTELDSAKRAYKALTDAYEEAVIRATTSQSELRVEAKPHASIGPVSPIKIYHVGLAGALAALLAVGLAYVLDFFNIRLFLPRPRGQRPQREASPPGPTAPVDAAAQASAAE